MKLQACYEQIGANYKDLVVRLGSEAFAQLFAKKFLEDDSFANIKQGLDANDAETAFRAAHTLKGVAQNLSLDNLYRPAFDLTESLRSRVITAECAPLYAKVEEEYNKTIAALQQLD